MIDRYLTEDMKSIWEQEAYYRLWKDIETELLLVRGEKDAAERLRAETVTAREISDMEEINGHELNAFLAVAEKKIPGITEKLHKGITSSDIMDTARMIQVARSFDLIEISLKELFLVLRALASKYADTVIAGRTHGQWAEPVTLGLKFARFASEAKRTLSRFTGAEKRIRTGKISGAVGTYSHNSPEEEEQILKRFGLYPAEISSQVIPRDIIAEYIMLLSFAVSVCEGIATEIRLLSQDGIKEAEEPFTERQKGSSVMPHKRNPVICERICGLSRQVKNYISLALSNTALWNERDISHSSNERLMLEDASCLAHYILVKTKYVVSNIRVNEENISRNLSRGAARLVSSGIMKYMIEKGIPREEAYLFLQAPETVSLPAEGLARLISGKYGFDEKEILKAADITGYLRFAEKIIERLDL